jgi:hypothetical protein
MPLHQATDFWRPSVRFWLTLMRQGVCLNTRYTNSVAFSLPLPHADFQTREAQWLEELNKVCAVSCI